MNYFYTCLPYIFAIASIAGSFFAGWFIATDKNRNELFKQKLESYRILSAQISKVYTLGVCLDKTNPGGTDIIYKKEASALFTILCSEAIFLEQSTMKQIFKFIKMQPSEYSQNKDVISNILDTFRDDLRLKRLNVINQIASLK